MLTHRGESSATDNDGPYYLAISRKILDANLKETPGPQ